MRQLRITNSITTRESESLNRYLLEIGRIEMITPEEEVRLTVLIKKGDQAAMDRLVRANLRFVVSVAKKYQGQGLSLPDLINEGNFGLIKAAKGFDETRGFKFISYAVWWIRQYILIAIAEQSKMIRVPFNKTSLNRQIQKSYLQLEQQLEREPSAEEIAGTLNMETAEVAASLNQHRHFSLDAPISNDEEGTMLETLEDPNSERTDQQSTLESLKIEVDRCLKTLTERQKEVICYFFGIGIDQPMSLDNIGERLFLTRERVRQIKDKAIERIRSNKQSLLLKEFTGS